MTASAASLARVLADALEAAGIPYAVGGALALGVWGFPRATNDVDLDVFVDPAALDPVFDVFERVGCTDDERIARWKRLLEDVDIAARELDDDP